MGCGVPCDTERCPESAGRGESKGPRAMGNQTAEAAHGAL